jgi:hypothetical protein
MNRLSGMVLASGLTESIPMPDSITRCSEPMKAPSPVKARL